MPTRSADDLSEALRRAIVTRDTLRPGTPAHWRASCDVRALQKRLVAAMDDARELQASSRSTAGQDG